MCPWVHCRKCVQPGFHSSFSDSRAWGLNCYAFHLHWVVLHILSCVAHLEACLGIDTNGRPTRKSTSASRGVTEALWMGYLWMVTPCSLAISTLWVHLIQWNLPGEAFSVHLTLTTLCSPLLIVLSLCKDGMHAKDKQRWIVKSILPFLPPPSSIPLQRKLQRRVLSWSGIKMSSEHIVLISLILQLAAEVCISMSNFGLRENNDLLWLPFFFFFC